MSGLRTENSIHLLCARLFVEPALRWARTRRRLEAGHAPAHLAFIHLRKEPTSAGLRGDAPHSIVAGTRKYLKTRYVASGQRNFTVNSTGKESRVDEIEDDRC